MAKLTKEDIVAIAEGFGLSNPRVFPHKPQSGEVVYALRYGHTHSRQELIVTRAMTRTDVVAYFDQRFGRL